MTLLRDSLAEVMGVDISGIGEIAVLGLQSTMMWLSVTVSSFEQMRHAERDACSAVEHRLGDHDRELREQQK